MCEGQRVGQDQKFSLGHTKLKMLLDTHSESTAASGLHRPEAWPSHLGWNSKYADYLQMNDIETGCRTDKQRQMSVEGGQSVKKREQKTGRGEARKAGETNKAPNQAQKCTKGGEWEAASELGWKSTQKVLPREGML